MNRFLGPNGREFADVSLIDFDASLERAVVQSVNDEAPDALRPLAADFILDPADPAVWQESLTCTVAYMPRLARALERGRLRIEQPLLVLLPDSDQCDDPSGPAIDFAKANPDASVVRVPGYSRFIVERAVREQINRVVMEWMQRRVLDAGSRLGRLSG